MDIEVNALELMLDGKLIRIHVGRQGLEIVGVYRPLSPQEQEHARALWSRACHAVSGKS